MKHKKNLIKSAKARVTGTISRKKIVPRNFERRERTPRFCGKI
jgi:hypothetical protein